MECAEGNYNNVLKSTGCTDLNCLLTLTAEQLGRSSEKVYFESEGIGCGYAPVVDGVELWTHPWIMMTSGDIADVPVMLGTNSDEGAIFTTFPHDGNADQLHEYWLSKGYTEDEIVTLNFLYVDGKTYPDLDFATVYWWAAQRSYGDDFMSCPSEYTSQQFGLQKNAGTRQNDLYFYHFEHTPRFKASVTRHVSELEYVFHQSELTAHADDEKMADVMSSYWGNFLTAGNPNEISIGMSRLPNWPEYLVETDNVLIIKDASDVKVGSHLKESECQFAIPRIDASVRSRFPSK